MFRSKAAVVGTGFIGPVHLEGLIRAGVSVRGALGTDVSKSKRIAAEFGLEKAYGSIAELLADPEVDVVHLTSPNRFHFDQAIQCLEAGKHVLCEKPLAMNSRQSAELVSRAAASGLKAGVNYNVRFYPICLEAAARIRRGDLGDVFHITGSYTQDWLHQPTDFNWRVLASEGGPLRALADIGTHWLDLVQSISGLSVQSVFADLQTVHPIRTRPHGNVETFTNPLTSATSSDRIEIPIDTEDYGGVMLRFENGARGLMHVSQVSAGFKNCIRFDIAGSKQSMSWNSQRPDELIIGHRDGPNEVLLRDPSLFRSNSARNHVSYPGGHNEGFPDTFKQLFRSFYHHIEADRETQPEPRKTPSEPLMAAYPTFEDGHREILLCEALLKSAHVRGWVSI